MIKTLATVALTCLLNANTQVSGAAAPVPPTGDSKCPGPENMELSEFGQFKDGNQNEWVSNTAKELATHLSEQYLQDILGITSEYTMPHIENLNNGNYQVFVSLPAETGNAEPVFEIRSELGGDFMEIDVSCSGDVQSIEMSTPIEDIPESVRKHILLMAEAHGVDPSQFGSHWEGAVNFDPSAASADKLTPLNAEYELESVPASGDFEGKLLDFVASDRLAKTLSAFTTVTDASTDYGDKTHPLWA